MTSWLNFGEHLYRKLYSLFIGYTCTPPQLSFSLPSFSFCLSPQGHTQRYKQQQIFKLSSFGSACVLLRLYFTRTLSALECKGLLFSQVVCRTLRPETDNCHHKCPSSLPGPPPLSSFLSFLFTARPANANHWYSMSFVCMLLICLSDRKDITGPWESKPAHRVRVGNSREL